MELYHGSYTIVERPRISPGRYTKDFGVGFYCTQLRQQAERWARKYDVSEVNVYDYCPTEGLRTLEFQTMDDAWLDFIVDCRAGKAHDYDIVTGAMADDQIYNYLADFIGGIITREQFWVLAKFKHPTHQIAFCTEKALQCITFQSSYRL